ncbi:hypothetical protein BHE74_00008448 [Ensete ventricosum]|nr:hypothetical protein BHE74_00008448 [Ensete ventricosum]RZR96533.1 hypothetical protein BHM03_00025570 [Ensete ventricosum]
MAAVAEIATVAIAMAVADTFTHPVPPAAAMRETKEGVMRIVKHPPPLPPKRRVIYDSRHDRCTVINKITVEAG